VGKTAILPIVGRRLPIIADEYVKTDFGTGALKITPGHDPNDFDIGRKHGLEEISAIGEDGRMTPAAGPDFEGMTALEARDAVVARLRAEGKVSKTEPYTHNVPYSHRSGERIEPLISLQWFMKMEDLARPAIDVVRDGQLKIHPPSQERRYIDWLENIRPWCISRQLWWGHQIPVWYRGDEVHVDTEPPEGEGWERDPDVLDTWFSSGLWPFATLGWPDDTPQLRAFYPTDVLSTARDILFLWVARMVMLGLEFPGKIPFERVNVHPVIQAPDGRRMSKSLGTGIDPLDLIERYGADATRFGLLAMSSTQDVRFSEERIARGQQITNKLWNASRLILTRISPEAALPASQPAPGAAEDAWILARLHSAIADISAAIEGFEFHRAAARLDDFVYAELCDWYLELVKPRLYAEDNHAVSEFVLHVLGQTLALAHPIIPFVTEEIWSYVPGSEGLLMAHAFPRVEAPVAGEERIERAITAIKALRTWRDSVGAAPSARIPARLDADGYDEVAEHVERLGRLEWGADGGEAVAAVAVPGGSIAVLASDAVDLEGASRRAAARGAEIEAEIKRAEGKLSNQGFVAKAPAEVVQAERDKVARLRRELEELG
jgi:valyl-tRNA synthetase